MLYIWLHFFAKKKVTGFCTPEIIGRRASVVQILHTGRIVTEKLKGSWLMEVHSLPYHTCCYKVYDRFEDEVRGISRLRKRVEGPQTSLEKY